MARCLWCSKTQVDEEVLACDACEDELRGMGLPKPGEVIVIKEGGVIRDAPLLVLWQRVLLRSAKAKVVEVIPYKEGIMLEVSNFSDRKMYENTPGRLWTPLVHVVRE